MTVPGRGVFDGRPSERGVSDGRPSPGQAHTVGVPGRVGESPGLCSGRRPDGARHGRLPVAGGRPYREGPCGALPSASREHRAAP